VTKARKRSGKSAIPPPQHHLAQAVRKATAALADQTANQLAWLGAVASPDGGYALRVLGQELSVQLPAGTVRCAGADVRHAWQLLVLHYLNVRSRPTAGEPRITFAELASGRTYAGVFRQRVNRRLCATVGADVQTLCASAAMLAARPVAGGDASFDPDVFPQLPVRIIYHAADAEFGPSATVLLPACIEELLCVEDIVVMSEQVVARLSGKPF